MSPHSIPLQSESLIAGKEAVTARGAVIVGPLQFERSEDAVEGLRASTSVARRNTARTGVVDLLAVAVIGVEDAAG